MSGLPAPGRESDMGDSRRDQAPLRGNGGDHVPTARDIVGPQVANGLPRPAYPPTDGIPPGRGLLSSYSDYYSHLQHRVEGAGERVAPFGQQLRRDLPVGYCHRHPELELTVHERLCRARQRRLLRESHYSQRMSLAYQEGAYRPQAQYPGHPGSFPLSGPADARMYPAAQAEDAAAGFGPAAAMDRVYHGRSLMLGSDRAGGFYASSFHDPYPFGPVYPEDDFRPPVEPRYRHPAAGSAVRYAAGDVRAAVRGAPPPPRGRHRHKRARSPSDVARRARGHAAFGPSRESDPGRTQGASDDHAKRIHERRRGAPPGNSPEPARARDAARISPVESSGRSRRPSPTREEERLSAPSAEEGAETDAEPGAEDGGGGAAAAGKRSPLRSVPLALPEDGNYLTEFHCFLRKHCVQFFCATDDDVNAPRRGRKKPVKLGQVGIRCMHCSKAVMKLNGAVYYPHSVSGIYNATMIIQQRHFHECPDVPSPVRLQYDKLKLILARSGAAKGYWAESARKLGFVDGPDGITFAPERQLAEISIPSKAQLDESVDQAGLLVEPDDKQYTTQYAYMLMGQMKRCVFSETDRLGKRKAHRLGFPGIACKYCFGANGTGRYFPSSTKTFADVSKTLNVLHSHLSRCKGCPSGVKEEMNSLKTSHQAEKEAKAFGSQKIFFDLVWERLHNAGECNNEGSEKTAVGAANRGPIPDPNDKDAASLSNCSAQSRSDFTVDDVANVMATTLCRAPVVWTPGKRRKR